MIEVQTLSGVITHETRMRTRMRSGLSGACGTRIPIQCGRPRSRASSTGAAADGMPAGNRHVYTLSYGSNEYMYFCSVKTFGEGRLDNNLRDSVSKKMVFWSTGPKCGNYFHAAESGRRQDEMPRRYQCAVLAPYKAGHLDCRTSMV